MVSQSRDRLTCHRVEDTVCSARDRTFKSTLLKIGAFDVAGQRRHALVIGTQLHPLPDHTDIFKMLHEDAVLARCEQPIPLHSVRLQPNVQPSAIRDFITFERHVVGSYAGLGGLCRPSGTKSHLLFH